MPSDCEGYVDWMGLSQALLCGTSLAMRETGCSLDDAESSEE